MQPVRRWRIHIGAHKTATTHFQDCLASQRSDLIKAGVDYIPRERLREVGFGKLFRASGWRRVLPEAMNRDAFDAAIRSLRIGPQTVAISDETIAGGVAMLFRFKIYPDIENRLRALQKSLGDAEIDLFLSIRSFDALLPSAYVQALRSRPVKGGFSALLQSWMRHPPSWVELAERVSGALPGARLHIWTYEDYAARPLPIQQFFVGTAAVRALDLPRPKATRTPSREAVSQLEQIGFCLTRSQYRRVAARICEEDQGSTVYSPLDLESQEWLADSYAKDLDRLRQMEFCCIGHRQS